MTRGAIVALALLAGCAAPTPPRIAAVPAGDALPLGTLPPQRLAKGQCAVFLWRSGDSAQLVLMAGANPPIARIVLDGAVRDLPRTAGGDEADGAAAQTRTVYGDGTTSLTLDLTIENRQGLTDGAMIPRGSLALDRAGRDGIVLPVSGMLGCAR